MSNSKPHPRACFDEKCFTQDARYQCLDHVCEDSCDFLSDTIDRNLLRLRIAFDYVKPSFLIANSRCDNHNAFADVVTIAVTSIWFSWGWWNLRHSNIL